LLLVASGFPQEMVEETQREVIELVASRPADVDNVSIFINTYDGVQLTNVLRADANDQFLGQLTDALGNPVFAPQLVAAEKPAGDFLELYWRRIESQQLTKAITYVTGFNDWRWILGAEFLADRLDAQIAEQRHQLEARVQCRILYILLIVGALVLV